MGGGQRKRRVSFLCMTALLGSFSTSSSSGSSSSSSSSSMCRTSSRSSVDWTCFAGLCFPSVHSTKGGCQERFCVSELKFRPSPCQKLVHNPLLYHNTLYRYTYNTPEGGSSPGHTASGPGEEVKAGWVKLWGFGWMRLPAANSLVCNSDEVFGDCGYVHTCVSQ